MEYLGPTDFRRPIRHGPDPNELGHPVSLSFVMGRNEIAAVGVTGFIAYHNGLAFTLTVVFADSKNQLTPLRSTHDVRLAQVRGEPSPPDDEQFRLAMSFSDGSLVTTSGAFTYEDEEGLALTMLDGSGGGVTSVLRWFLEPLPPPGPVLFSCEWPTANISFRHRLDVADEIQDAAKKSAYLFRPPAG